MIYVLLAQSHDEENVHLFPLMQNILGPIYSFSFARRISWDIPTYKMSLTITDNNKNENVFYFGHSFFRLACDLAYLD